MMEFIGLFSNIESLKKKWGILFSNGATSENSQPSRDWIFSFWSSQVLFTSRCFVNLSIIIICCALVGSPGRANSPRTPARTRSRPAARPRAAAHRCPGPRSSHHS